jgi:hypothetical protein
MKFIDLTGKKFNKLKVTRYIGKTKRGISRWLCLCACGNKTIVNSDSLKNGNTKSCGCLYKGNDNAFKHGHTAPKTFKTYHSWDDMIKRCNNPKNKYYKNYGGRGISVCERWLRFENFLEDMGKCPKGLSIDRINNNRNYYKENCRWATTKEQNRNKRNNLTLACFEKSQLLIEWAEEYKVNYKTLWNRIYIRKLSIEKALTTPVRKRRK